MTIMTDEDIQELRDWFGEGHEEWCGFERNALVVVALSELAERRRRVCKTCRAFRPKGGKPHCAIGTWSVGLVTGDDFTDEVDEKDTCGKWEPKP